MENIHSLGKINKQLLQEEFGELGTEEIIVTDERIEHIKIRHPEDYNLFKEYGVMAIEDPDSIIKDEKNKGTAFFIKAIEGTNLNVVVRLVLAGDNIHYKNSVMTFYRIRHRNLLKLAQKNKVIYKKE